MHTLPVSLTWLLVDLLPKKNHLLLCGNKFSAWPQELKYGWSHRHRQPKHTKEQTTERKRKEEGGKQRGVKMTYEKKRDEQTAVRDSDRDHQLSHTYTHPSSPPSHHLSIITPFQHHCKSLHLSITRRIIDKPPIHPSTLNYLFFFMHFPFAANMLIYLSAFRLSSIC